MNEAKNKRDLGIAAIDRIADGVDLTIDLLTLGQYGLERTSAGNGDCEGIGTRLAGRHWEALPQSRRGRDRDCEWEWPSRPCPTVAPA